MPSITTCHWEQDGGLVYIPLGFVPNWVRLIDYHTDTNIVSYEWFNLMETDQATGKQEGISFTEGVTANLADDGGIVAYQAASQIPTISAWTEAVSTAATARTATAHGTYVKATVSGADDAGLTVGREAIFECVTAGTGGSTEPTWPSIAGDQVTDNSVVWERVDHDVVLTQGGYDGIRVSASIQTNGQEMYCLAIKSDNNYDLGDVDGWSSGVQGA
jgi:hypothetical protein